MQAVIGARLVNSLRPAERPYEVRDTRTRGFLLRVQPSGTMAYIAEYGRGKRMTLGRVGTVSPVQARDKAREVLSRAELGHDPMDERRQARAHTLDSFLEDEFGPWARTHRKRGKATVARLRSIFPDLLDKKLGEITPWLVEKWRGAQLKAGRKPTGVNRDLDDLKACLAKAVEWGLLETHPLARVRRTRVDRTPVVRYLTADEEQRLRATLDAREAKMRATRERANAWRRERGYPEMPADPMDHVRPMVLTALNTGLRRGELFNLEWEDVDLERAILTVHGGGAKSSQTRHVPLNGEARAVLADWRERAGLQTGYVFASRKGGRFDNINRAWRSVVKSAQLPGFRFHDLRHSFASRLVMAGVDLNTVRELLGHGDMSMTLRYAHLAPEHKAAAVAQLERDAG